MSMDLMTPDKELGFAKLLAEGVLAAAVEIVKRRGLTVADYAALSTALRNEVVNGYDAALSDVRLAHEQQAAWGRDWARQMFNGTCIVMATDGLRQAGVLPSAATEVRK